MTPIIIPVASGSWGIGPSLLYLVGMVGILIWLVATTPRMPRRRDMEADRLRDIERQKEETFTRLLIEAAQERRKG